MTRFIASAFISGLLTLSSALAAEYPPWRLGMNMQIVSAGFEIIPMPPGDKGKKLTYRPAQSTYVGVILGYKWLGGTLAFSVPANPEKRALEGTSKYSDYRLSYYVRHWGIEASYNQFQGYLIENSSALSQATLAGNTFYKIPNLKTRGYGFNFYYIRNPKTYSLPAAMDQSEMQTKSGGSSVILVATRFQTIENDGPLIPIENRPNFGNDQNIRSLNGTNVSTAWGYAYNWVPGPFYLSALGAFGLGYQNTRYQVDGEEFSRGSAAVNAHLRFGTGVNIKRFFLTGNFALDRIGLGTETLEVGGNLFCFTLAAGSRF